MMPLAFGELFILLLSGGGGGNDLLDYLPTDVYWRQKGVPIAVERMVSELATAPAADLGPLIRDLGADDFKTRDATAQKLRALGPAAAPALKKAADSDDPEVRTNAREILKSLPGGHAAAVRRLMAIRTLGELKKADALPALRPLIESKELFVADYAAQAVAAIEGKPYERPRPTEATLRRDLALLPAHCGIVGQAAMPPGKPIAFDKVLQHFKDVQSPMTPGIEPAALLDQVAKMVLLVAERVGNVRLDAVTLGISDDIGSHPQRGFVVLIARGLYDVEAAKSALAETGLASSRVDGLDVLSPEREVSLILANNDRLVIALCPGEREGIQKELAASIKGNSDQLALGAEMLQLIKSVDATSPLWAVTRLSESYRTEPLFAPFESATLTTKPRQDGAMALTLVAQGKDSAAVKAAAERFESGVKEALAEVTKEADRVAFLKPIGEILSSVRIKTDEARTTVTALVKGTPSVMLVPMLLFSGRHMAMPAEAPAPPAKALEPIFEE